MSKHDGSSPVTFLFLAALLSALLHSAHIVFSADALDPALDPQPVANVFEGKEGDLIFRESNPIPFNASSVYTHLPLRPSIAYGGVLALLDNESGLISANDPNALFVAKVALKFLETAQSACLRKDAAASLPSLTLMHALPLKHTQDGHTQHRFSYRTRNAGVASQPTQFGVTYSFFLEWTYDCPVCCLLQFHCKANSSAFRHIHRFVLSHNSMDRGYHLFSHTWFDLPVHEAAEFIQAALASVSKTDEVLPKRFALSHPVPLSDGPDVARAWSPRGFPLSAYYSTLHHTRLHHARHDKRAFAASPPPPPRKELDVLCFNVWNVNGRDDGRYMPRFKWMGRQLLQSNADIIALQEVRFDNAFMSERRAINQAYDLSVYLPGYQFVFQPAMSYPENVLGRVEEGLAIYSRHPILRSGYVLLEREDTGDEHQRICLHAEIHVPHVGSVHVFVSHFSLVERARNNAVVRIWHFMQRFHPKQPALFMGDLNTTPESKAMQFLNGKAELHGETTQSRLKDVWLELHPEPRPGDLLDEETGLRDQPHDPPAGHPSYGFTFNVHGDTLTKRIDYMYLKDAESVASDDAHGTFAPVFSASYSRSSRLVPRTVRLFGTEKDPRSGQHPSDHYGLLATFDAQDVEAAA